MGIVLIINSVFNISLLRLSMVSLEKVCQSLCSFQRKKFDYVLEVSVSFLNIFIIVVILFTSLLLHFLGYLNMCLVWLSFPVS